MAQWLRYLVSLPEPKGSKTTEPHYSNRKKAIEHARKVKGRVLDLLQTVGTGTSCKIIADFTDPNS